MSQIFTLVLYYHHTYVKIIEMKPITKNELWHAQITLLLAIFLQLTLSNSLRLGPRYLIAGLELLLVFAFGFTAPRRHNNTESLHKVLSTIFIFLVSLANAVQLGFLTRALIDGSSLPGKTLLSDAIAIFLTNIIVFGLWYWELDSPGLSGTRSKAKTHLQFPQSISEKHEAWRPTFFDYLYLSITNSTAFSPTDTMPLTHIAKALMSAQALVALLTVVLVTARAVNILG